MAGEALKRLPNGGEAIGPRFGAQLSSYGGVSVKGSRLRFGHPRASRARRHGDRS